MRFLFLILFLMPVFSFAEMPAKTDFRYVDPSTTRLLGTANLAGDILEKLVIVPATTGAGTVQIKDGSSTAFTVLVAGTLTNLTPITLHLGMRSQVGSWSVITNANENVIAIGRFRGN